MAIYDKASLVLIPSGTKTSKVYSQKPTNGDGDFTFSRSTAATRVNASGNIEKETENLLYQSNNFDSGFWTKTNASVTSGQSGYDGSNNAWLFEKSAWTYITQATSISSVNTFSIYAKAATLSHLLLYVRNANNGKYFDLVNGTIGSDFVGSPIDAKIESVGNGWYRCSVTTNDATNNVRIYSASADNDTSSTSGSIYIQDAQLNQGLIAQEVITTTTTAIYGGITDNVPRLDYTDSSCPALLLEPQRTNAIQQSEYFNVWNTIVDMTINANQGTSPEGVQNATNLVPTTTSVDHFIDKSGHSRTAGQYLVQSVYAKANGYNYINLSNAASRLYAAFDLANGQVDYVSSNGTDFTNHSASIEDVGNGWYRCVLIGQAVTTSATYARLAVCKDSINGATQGFAGDGTSGVLVYGAQVELNSSYATSYIPTYGSAVTRNADDTSLTGVSDLIGQTEGTMFFEGSVEHTPENVSIMNFDRSTQYSVSLLKASNDKINAFVYNGGSFLFNIVSTAISGRFKCAVAYKSGDTAFYVNGTQIGVNTTTFTPAATLDDIYIGSYLTPYFAYDHPVECNQALVFKTRLSNEELATLTTI